MPILDQSSLPEENKESPYAVICPTHGRVFMSFDSYMMQLADPFSKWSCPVCKETADFDDDWYASHSI